LKEASHVPPLANVAPHYQKSARIGFSQALSSAWRDARSALYLALIQFFFVLNPLR
jgi:hypothetical protein